MIDGRKKNYNPGLFIFKETFNIHKYIHLKLM